jgi:hypothetical protein
VGTFLLRLGWAYLTKKVPYPRRGHSHRHRLQILYWTQKQKKWAPESLTDIQKLSFGVFLENGVTKASLGPKNQKNVFCV